MSTTTQLLTILGIMLSINIGLTLFQSAILDVNAGATNVLELSDSPYSKYIAGSGDNISLNVGDNYIPEDEQDEADVSGNQFTDTFNAVKGWFTDKLAPLGFIPSMLKQPMGFLIDIGINPFLAVAFGVIWYLLALIIIVTWWRGG